MSNFLVAQVTRHALFIGNSYTYVNNLPQILSSIATSTGDVLLYDSHTPGGYIFQAHASDVTTFRKIAMDSLKFCSLIRAKSTAFVSIESNTNINFSKSFLYVITIQAPVFKDNFQFSIYTIEGKKESCGFI